MLFVDCYVFVCCVCLVVGCFYWLLAFWCSFCNCSMFRRCRLLCVCFFGVIGRLLFVVCWTCVVCLFVCVLCVGRCLLRVC